MWLQSEQGKRWEKRKKEGEGLVGCDGTLAYLRLGVKEGSLAGGTLPVDIPRHPWVVVRKGL